ncbi:MG284/MPN403 family protein [Mycoplasma buteonis]|uniref:MG284/MPN403 family protein n=1 Tax=Mycoplasma buteonis TaxID=171280 RepID=UPI00055EA272|nr:hypothetical protein [Mycoplasma buteonis]
MKTNNKSDDDELYTQQLEFLKSVFRTYEAYRKQLRYDLFTLKYELMNKVNDLEIQKQMKLIEEKLNGKGSLISLILSMMDKENAWIIEKCHLDSESSNNPHWYLDYFSKTTFYKKKRLAVKEFVNFYFNNFDV